MAKPYAVPAGAGTRFEYGIVHEVLAGERPGRGLAACILDTCHGEEPPLHTHRTEDEVFYVLDGQVEFRCDGQAFGLGPGGFVFLPCGIPHTYAIPEGSRARMLVLTYPAVDHPEGWGGYLADVASQGTPVT